MACMYPHMACMYPPPHYDMVNIFQESCDAATPKSRTIDTHHLPTLSLRGYCNLTNAILQTHHQRAPLAADGEDEDAGMDANTRYVSSS